MRACYRSDCLNHDLSKPLNCQEYDGGVQPEGRCGQFASAASLMRTFRPGCHRNARGRWVGDKAVVYR
ncbi:MAG TPA: hypothetical protein VN521_04110 [Negativicutes bacterium]|nr:hypothetical protein [Negativicutes bacterium]